MTTNYIIVDDNGMPTGSMDVEQVQEDAINLALTLAAHSGDEPKVEQILMGQVTRHTTHGLSLVLIAAIKHMTNDIVAGAFNFMEATPGLYPRAKMAEIAAAEGPQ